MKTALEVKREMKIKSRSELNQTKAFYIYNGYIC
jgi:hypothetical protein